MRRRSMLPALVVLTALLTFPVVASAEPASVDCATTAQGNDFNGDGLVDLAVADAGATIGAVAAAGRVHVLFGGAPGAVSLVSPQAGVAGKYGRALAVVDFNGDDCDDLLVGAPAEPVGAVAGAGHVYLYQGSPAGLGPPIDFRQGTGFAGDTPETGDAFGSAIAAGVTTAGTKFVIVGAPGESVGTLAGAGSVHYLRGGVWTQVTENSPGVQGASEAGDHFGAVLAASSLHFAVAMPDDDLDQFTDSGNVDVFSHTFASSVPASVGFLNQEMAGQSGYAEVGDHYGAAMSMVTFTDTDAKAKSMLAIGIPGEDLSPENDAGRIVATVTISDAIETTEYEEIHQGSTDVAGAREAGDKFGSSIVLVNRAAPGTVPLWSDLLCAVGVPGEDGSTAGRVDVGGVQVFSMIGSPGAHDVWADPDIQPGTGWTPTPGARLGTYLGASQSHLFVSDPHGVGPAVYAIPWGVLTGQATDPIKVLKPGSDGIPPTGTGILGTAVA